MVKKIVEKTMVSAKTTIRKEVKKVSTQNLEAKNRDNALDKEVRNQFNKISTKLNEV